MQENPASNKIKLLIAVPSLECGGLERNVLNICNNINNRKFETTLVIINNENPFYKVTNHAIKVISLNKKNVRKAIFDLKKIVDEHQPDIVLSTANHLNLLFVIFMFLFPRKTIFIARESSIVSINTRRNKFPFLFDKLLKLCYRKFDHIVCQSKYMQQDLLTYYKIPEQKTSIINNAVVLPEHWTETREFQSSRRYITVARLSEEKGIDNILRALQKTTTPFQYTIIGDGPLMSSLKQLTIDLKLQQHVLFAGAHSSPYSVVSEPDLFLMGSHYEGFPNVLLEANSLGIPAVCFDAPGGINEVIDSGVNGILVPINNLDAFATAVDKASLISFDRKKIQELTLESYSTKSMMDKWETLFLSVFKTN
jgi:glycosyltransferase involved in cell wall biosynthesis